MFRKVNRFSSSTTILWGFSHGATHSSGTLSGVNNNLGTSNTIGGLGRVPSNARRDGVGSPALSGRQAINCRTTHLILLSTSDRYTAVAVPWPLVGQPSSNHGPPLLPISPLPQGVVLWEANFPGVERENFKSTQGPAVWAHQTSGLSRYSRCAAQQAQILPRTFLG